MKKLASALTMGAAVVAVGTLTACSPGAVNQSQTPAAGTVVTTAASAMPSSATFIADTPERNGETMTMAIAVENENVVAYATNGTDDEARFVGVQKDGRMELMSDYGDTLTASYDGSAVTGEVVMNVADAAPVKFAASSASAPAGLYSAATGDMRATVVVRPDRTMVGIMNLDTRGHTTVADARRADDRAFMEQVRQMRLNRKLQPAPEMSDGTLSMTMNGKTMRATRMDGDMSF